MPVASVASRVRARAATAVCLAVGLGALAAPAAAAPREDARAADARLAPLRLIDRITVLVEDLTGDAEQMALTRESIQGEAEARLRAAGLEVDPDSATPPALYFQISVLCTGPAGGCAIDVSSAVIQDVYLASGPSPSVRAKTWYTGEMRLAPRKLVPRHVRAAVQAQAAAFASDVMAARERPPSPPPSSASSPVVLGASR